MHLTGLDLLFWAVGFAGHVILIVVLWVRQRVRAFPFFTALICLNVVRTITLALIQLYGTRRGYFYTYWSLAILDVALQLGVVYEMASRVFRPLGKWAPDVRRAILWWIAGSLAVAASLTWIPTPSTRLWMQVVMIKGSFFTAALLSELFVGMIALSATAGLPWKTHVARISQALGIYSIFTVLVEAGSSYFGLRSDPRAYVDLTHVRMGLYLGCLSYWIVMLWRDAPPGREITPHMRRQLAAINAGAAHDLQQLRSRRER
jgi:hypothetical protein